MHSILQGEIYSLYDNKNVKIRYFMHWNPNEFENCKWYLSEDLKTIVKNLWWLYNDSYPESAWKLLNTDSYPESAWKFLNTVIQVEIVHIETTSGELDWRWKNCFARDHVKWVLASRETGVSCSQPHGITIPISCEESSQEI